MTHVSIAAMGNTAGWICGIVDAAIVLYPVPGDGSLAVSAIITPDIRNAKLQMIDVIFLIIDLFQKFFTERSLFADCANCYVIVPKISDAVNERWLILADLYAFFSSSGCTNSSSVKFASE